MDGKGDEQYADHVHEQIVTENDFPTPFVCQGTADAGAEGGAEGIGAQGAEQTDPDVVDIQIFLPQRQAAGGGNNGTGLNVVRQATAKVAFFPVTFLAANRLSLFPMICDPPSPCGKPSSSLWLQDRHRDGSP